MKPTKCLAKEKNKPRKGKKEERRESKSEDCCVTFIVKNYLKILVSVRDRTSQANILHLDQN